MHETAAQTWTETMATVRRDAGMRVRPVVVILAWIRRTAQRRHLAGLPDEALKDVGLTRATAWEEARKPFWQA